MINLTQHAPTAEQRAAGVSDPIPGVQELLNFRTLPGVDELWDRAEQIRDIVFAAWKRGTRVYDDDDNPIVEVMVGGAPFFMPVLEQTLSDAGIKVLYAFSERVAVEESQPDGSVKKSSVFRHVGFVEGAL